MEYFLAIKGPDPKRHGENLNEGHFLFLLSVFCSFKRTDSVHNLLALYLSI